MAMRVKVWWGQTATECLRKLLKIKPLLECGWLSFLIGRMRAEVSLSYRLNHLIPILYFDVQCCHVLIGNVQQRNGL